MDRASKVAAAVFGSTALILLIYLAGLAANAFLAASDNLKAAIIAGFLSLTAVFVGRYFEQRRELNQKINAEKIRVYEALVDILFSFFQNPDNKLSALQDGDANSSESDVVVRLRATQKELMFWGSDAVIAAWIDFLEEAQKAEPMSPERLAAGMGRFGRLIVTMRRDVGYRFTNIREHHVARMILRPGTDEQRLLDKIKADATEKRPALP